jgi:hypothetical protein
MPQYTKLMSSVTTYCFGVFSLLLFSPEHKHESGFVAQAVILSAHLHSKGFIALLLEPLAKNIVLQFSIHRMLLVFVINKHLQTY